MKNFILKHKNISLAIILFTITCSALLRKYGHLEFADFLGIKAFYLAFFTMIAIIAFLRFKKQITDQASLYITFPSLLLIYIFLITKFHDLHYIFDLLIGGWLILFGLFIIKKINEQQFNFQQNDLEESKNNKVKKTQLAFLFLVIIFHLFFSLYNANTAIYTDERLWTYGGEKRIQDFWKNIGEQNWHNTRVSDKPGITLNLISGISLLWTTPGDFKSVNNFDEEGKKDFAKMLFLIRLPVIIFTSLSLIIIYSFISKLFNPTTGIISTTLIGFSPLLIGISKLINPDALTWIFIPLTMFSYFIYQKNNKKIFLYSTGFLLGLGFLTKYITNLLLPFFLMEIFIQAILLKVEKENYFEFFKKKFLDFITIFIISLMTLYILYPGIWVELNRILLATIWSQPFKPVWIPFIAFILFFAFDIFILKAKIFSYIIEQIKKIKQILLIILPTIIIISIVFVLVDVYIGMKPFDFEKFITSPKTYGNKNSLAVYFSGFYGLIFGITPIVLTGLLINQFSNLKYFWQNKTLSFKKYVNWQISFFVLIYFLSSAFSNVVPMPRYQIIVYPLVILLSATGFAELIKKFNKKNLYIFLALIIVINSFILWNIKPFYFSYNSSLLPKQYLINPKDLGEGTYEIAEYLNNLPNAKNLNIWTDRVRICDFFVGGCSEKIDYDYYIVSSNRKNNSRIPIEYKHLYDCEKYKYKLTIAGRKKNYICVMPAK